jgi:hypothetical protein
MPGGGDVGATAKLRLEPKGLVLAPSQLARAPGAMTVANNVNVEAPGIIRSRQGFGRQANGFGGPAWKFISTKELGSNLLMNYGDASNATGLKYGDGSAAPTTIAATFNNRPESRMQCAVGRRNHYLTSESGPFRLESDYSIAHAGMPKGLALDLTGVTALQGTPGTLLADGSAAAYRVTWCKADQQGIVMEGPVGGRTVIYNRTGTSGYSAGVVKNARCRVLIPKQAGTGATDLTTAYFFRLYRSRVATGEPSDNMRLVAERYLSAGDITAGYVDFDDATLDTAFRDVAPTLYTNANDGGDDGAGGPGLQQSNEAPPRAYDVELFAECMFYASIAGRSAIEFTILSVAAGVGLTAGDTLSIAGRTYTAIAPGAPAAGQFVVATSTSVQEAIQRTAINLCEAINKDTGNTTVYAFYVSGSGAGDLVGRIRLERRDIGNAFTISASAHGTAYRPTLDTARNSVADEFPNALMFSKPNQPDAVPLVNLLKVGKDDTSVLRIKALGETLFVFSDSGLYRLTGRTVFDFSLREFDLGFRLRGRELVVECDGALYAWGVEGICRITDAGVEPISNQIEPMLWAALAATTETWMATYGWATAYRSRHKVLFWYPTGTSDKNGATALVYDTRMDAWTTWTVLRDASENGRSCGAVRLSDDTLFLGQWVASGGDSFIFKERRTYSAADYADDNNLGASGAIVKTIAWSPVVDAPDEQLHFDELHVFWEVSEAISAFTTPTAVTATVTPEGGLAGTIALAPTAGSRLSRGEVPGPQRRTTRLKVALQHSVSGEYFGVEGMSLKATSGTGRTVRS